MSRALLASRILTKGQDTATRVLTVLAFALPQAALLMVVGGVNMFYRRMQAPANAAQEEGIYVFYAAFAAVLLVVPIISMGSAAARLGVRRRERDLAVLRLVGLRPGSAKAAAVVQTVILAAVGAVLAIAIYAATLPLWQFIAFQNAAIDPAEMWMGPLLLAVSTLALLALAALAAWSSMRRVAITPLGVTRNTDARKVPVSYVVVAVLVFILWFGPGQILMTTSFAAMVVVMLLGVALVFLVVNLVGQWSMGLLGRIMHSRARTAQSLLAARRIMDDPKAVWRSFGAIALVGFIVGTVQPMATVVASAAMDPDDLLGSTMMIDIRTGIWLTFGIAFVLAAVSTAINQAARFVDQGAEARSLVMTGAPRSFLDRARRKEVLVPAMVTAFGSTLLGSLFMLPLMASPSGFVAFAVEIVFVAVGVAVVMAASETTRTLVPSVLSAG